MLDVLVFDFVLVVDVSVVDVSVAVSEERVRDEVDFLVDSEDSAVCVAETDMLVRWIVDFPEAVPTTVVANPDEVPHPY